MAEVKIEECIVCGKSFHSKRKCGKPCICENCSKMDWKEMIRTNLSRPNPMYEKSKAKENLPEHNRCLFCNVPLPKDMGICVQCSKKLKGEYYFTTTDNVATAVIKDTVNQSAKADADKPILSLVPKQIIYEIEKVRAFGSKKYKDPNNWKKVELERYHQALLRHTLAVWDDINAKDKESGLLHLSHIATNIAFILELMNSEER